MLILKIAVDKTIHFVLFFRTEKDASKWSKDKLKDLLLGLKVENDQGMLNINKLIDGFTCTIIILPFSITKSSISQSAFNVLVYNCVHLPRCFFWVI